MKYNLSVVKLASLFPLLMLFLTLAKGESSYSFASTSHQISFSQEFTRLSDESAVTAKINSNIAKENSDSSKPFSKYPFSENTKNEKEDEKEDDKEKDHVNPAKLKFLLGDDFCKQEFTALVDGKPYKKSLPLYLLFHSWKTHLI
jgi:hypothetical protein